MIKKEIMEYIKKNKIKKIYSERALETATIEILTSCNFKCIHCYNQDIEQRLLKFNDFKSIIDQLLKQGCKYITITGGEPLLHPDFEKIYHYCINKGLKISLFTNGYFIDKYLELFKEYAPKKIEISLYGANNKTYEDICKIKNGFNKVISNIKLLTSNKINLHLKTVIMEKNCKDFVKMEKLCSKMGLPFKFDLIILKSKNFSNNQSSNIINSKFTKFMNYIKDKKLNEWKTYPSRYKDKNKIDFLYKCYAGRKSIYIGSNCGARICNFAEFSEQNLKKISLSDAWKSFDKYMLLPDDKSSECYKCKYRSCCGNCPVSTYMNNKTDGKNILPVEQNCREAKFIYEAIKNDN